MRPINRQTLALLGIAVMCVLAAPPQASAQSNLEKAARLLEQQFRNGKGEFISFLTGAASAYRWVNGDTKSAERAYCPPPNVTLDGRTYAKIALDEYKRAKSEYAKVPEYPLHVLTLALWRGLRDTYPCKPGDAESSPSDTSAAPASSS